MSVHLLELRLDLVHMDLVGINEVVLLCLKDEIHLALEIYAELVELRKRRDYCQEGFLGRERVTLYVLVLSKGI